MHDVFILQDLHSPFTHYVTHTVHVDETTVHLNENIATATRNWPAGPASCSTLASYHVLSRQRTMTVNNRFRRSHSVYNSWQHLRCDDGRALL